jgi:hypothetical protein
MSSWKGSTFNRRQFLRTAGSAAALGASRAGAATRNVSIVRVAGDPIASAAPVHWACEELRQALMSRRVNVQFRESIDQTGSGDVCVLVAGGGAPAAREILAAAKASVPEGPEALVLAAGKTGGKAALLASGSDARGAVYALLELADRARHGSDPAAALEARKPVIERPANATRSIARCFESDVEDKSWFYDRDMWRAYLTMLATHRFNRFSLTLGLDYNFPRNVRDVYFYFAYPYLLPVPGYNVRVSNLPEAERDRNLETLRFIGEETVARGLQFQLGLWTHAYQWVDSPNAQATIEGLNAENHAPYCRDALLGVLQACPSISGITFRIHGESGVPEGNYDFWETVFQGIVRAGRKIEIDMHAKGMDQKMIDVAQATGMPVNVSPKYWAEHMGLAYHQADIRELEMAREGRAEGPFTLSGGSRSFLRYGWGDLLTEKRSYGVLHRIWPGTQRVLLWGDPALAAGYGRYSSFCGTQGVELCEPLSFKGRMGSGLPGGRCSYADSSLNPKYDWEKYLYTYRVWGRSIYNPDTDPEGWRRYLREELQGAAKPAEAALANASRILPLITTAHGASGSNNAYWPEIYTNMPIVDAERKHPYRDSPAPRRFGTVSPFDPQLFSRVDDFAAELLAGERSSKYSPLDYAQWLDDFSTAAAHHSKEMAMQGSARRTAAFRRVSADVAIQSGLGKFFADKLRSAVLWAIYERSGDKTALDEALKAYRSAREAWATMANGAKEVYMADITYGTAPHLRGHWLDRLPAIDDDIADMAKRVSMPAPQGHADADRVRSAVQEALSRPQRAMVACRHTPADRFRPGEPLAVELSLEKGNGRSILLHYRHVNQAERWKKTEMQARDNRYSAAIPAAYTQSAYALQYYFELRDATNPPRLYPGFQPDLSNQPYFLVRQG